jgi:ketosteroid isomerase-like protein
LTDDVQWWVPGPGLMTKEAFFAVAGAIAAKVKGNVSFKIHGATAENDRVAIEAESFGEMVDGKVYNNTYHFLFVFRDGKICLSKEYNDTRHAAEVFSG